MRKVAPFVFLGFLFSIWASAQSFQERILSSASQAPDLKFPDEATELSASSPLAMAIYKPAGAGRFPALILVHTCGGLRPEIRNWTKQALSRGYVVFVIDSLGPRGLKTVCHPPSPVSIWRGVKDSFQALDHLKRFEFVDPDRVGLMGFSWGAMVGLLASSKTVANVFSPSKRFAAVASFYPGCYFPASGTRDEIEFLRTDTDRPTLVLLGGADTETPPADCLQRLATLKGRGVPVSWYLYPKATHCWDCGSLNNFSKVDSLGHKVEYRYDEQITKDSGQGAFDFFANHLVSIGK
ncbi:MAG TPA: dienelactone hydrolase family protein [Thermoanaerobaculia bacterium]|nr:dienelactone hydrolase family protein [Thermoanaerobaculia bacterium]